MTHLIPKLPDRSRGPHTTLRWLVLVALPVLSYSQPATDVYLFDLELVDGTYQVSRPINVSDNPGYDNQPSFSSDGQYLYYTSWQEDEQTDLIEYEVSSGTKRRVTSTDGSEYSPTEVPGGDYLSTIRLERDGTQLLWRVPLSEGTESVLVPDRKIGYHCWLDKDAIYSFVLGDPNTFQRHDLVTGQHQVIDSNIGRSLHKIPGEEAISYISKKSDPWEVRRYSPNTGKTSSLAAAVENSEDLTWTSNGDIIMGSGSQLFVLMNGAKEWQLIADLSDHNLADITRLAVNPSSSSLAIVVND